MCTKIIKEIYSFNILTIIFYNMQVIKIEI